MPDIAITAATASDVGAIKALLVSNALPTAGVDEHWRTFVVARAHGRIVACGGAEAYQVAALLRSIAVDPDYRRRGLGRRIVRQLLDRLASRGLRSFQRASAFARCWKVQMATSLSLRNRRAR